MTIDDEGVAMPGVLFVIVGPSGVGKDSLVHWLKHRLADRPNVLFVRRTVTRPADVELEDHDTMDHSAFDEARRAGRFAVTWDAHGLSYGLPIDALDHVRKGGVAICNGSRGALDDIKAAFGSVKVLHIQVAADELERRLRARGRESESEINARLGRNVSRIPSTVEISEIDNSGPIEIAGQRILEEILQSQA